MIEAVFFDLDGTLFDRDAAVAGVLAWQGRMFAGAIRPESSVAFVHRVTAFDEHGHRDKRNVYEIVAAEFGLDASVRDRLIDSFWTEYPQHCRPGLGVPATLVELRQRGKRLGIITNGVAAVQNATIDALGVRGSMDVILISETEGVPDQPDLYDVVTWHRGLAERRRHCSGDVV